MSIEKLIGDIYNDREVTPSQDRTLKASGGMGKFLAVLTVLALFVVGFFLITSLRKQGLGEVAYPKAVLSIPRQSYSALEPVVMIVHLEKQRQSRRWVLPQLIHSAYAISDGPISVTVDDPKGKATDDIKVMIAKKSETVYEISATPHEEFQPGKYTMRVSLSDGLATREITQDFFWGVLAINTNKSVYAPGETARLSMAVLDEHGEMVCDADITLVITDPNGVKTVHTTGGQSIRANPVCYEKVFTLDPDFEARYTTSVIGTYTMELTAKTRTGTYTIHDFFDVSDNIPFVITRESVTRIFPPLTYPMTLIITANQDFDGYVQEVVPDAFQISELPGVIKFDEEKTITPSESSSGQKQHPEKLLIWHLAIKKGETIQIGYRFITPPKSPDFYLLGPFSFVENSSPDRRPLYQMSRKWQLAIDADGSGTNVVSPTNSQASGTGKTYTFTYTTGETVATGSGQFTIQEPVSDDWTVPQTSNAGAAGYTIFGSGTGTPGQVLDNADANTGWNFVGTNACSSAAPTVDTAVRTEGTGDLKCINGNITTGRGFYDAISSTDWTNYTTVGVWLRASAAQTTTTVRFSYDDTAALASPIADVNMSGALVANVWQWETFALSGTRNAILSYGITCGSSTACDSVTWWADYFLIGPGLPTVSGTSPWTITVPIITIPANTGTIVVTYGSGGGAGGVTNSASGGSHTFTTKSKIAENPKNALSTIASSPIVTLDTAPLPTPTPGSGEFQLNGLQMQGVDIN